MFFLGVLLGLGAAIPIGPINLEIIRRNLHFGMRFGVSFGSGACFADLTYLLLLSLGVFTFLTHATVLKVVGVIGSAVLMWFGISALRSHQYSQKNPLGHMRATAPLWRHAVEGYVLTLFNPMTILFWSSISAQIAVITQQQTAAIIFAGAGVLSGTYLWVMTLNLTLHWTRHKISHRVMHYLNIAGGLILIAFALIGFCRSLT